MGCAQFGLNDPRLPAGALMAGKSPDPDIVRIDGHSCDARRKIHSKNHAAYDEIFRLDPFFQNSLDIPKTVLKGEKHRMVFHERQKFLHGRLGVERFHG